MRDCATPDQPPAVFRSLGTTPEKTRNTGAPISAAMSIQKWARWTSSARAAASGVAKSLPIPVPEIGSPEAAAVALIWSTKDLIDAVDAVGIVVPEYPGT